MPRTKVKLAFIENNKSRKSSFTKRKESLKKKLHELCTLCGVDACLILYIPNECEPELWPNKDAVLDVVRQFRAKPEIERRKNMLDLESYLVEKINKAKEKLNKHVMVNRELVKEKMLSDCLSGKVSVADLNPTELKELVSFAGLKILDINQRMELLTNDAHAAAATPQPQHPQPPTVVGDSSTSNNKTTEGTYVEPYVPVMKNTRPSDVEENIDWFPSDWVSDHEDNGLALVPSFDKKKSFTKDLWSDTFFLKKD